MRSHRWFGVDDLRSFGHRSRTLQMGFDREDNFISRGVNAAVEYFFPWRPDVPRRERAKLAWYAFRHARQERHYQVTEFAEHER